MQSSFLSQSDPASRVGAGGVRGVASQERLSEVIMELPFFFFVPFSPLLFISSSVSLTIIYMSVLSALLFAAHTHTHTHTTHTHTLLSQLLHVSLSDISTVTPVKQEPNIPMADGLMLLPPRNNNVWSQRTLKISGGLRGGEHTGAQHAQGKGGHPGSFLGLCGALLCGHY